MAHRRLSARGFHGYEPSDAAYNGGHGFGRHFHDRAAANGRIFQQMVSYSRCDGGSRLGLCGCLYWQQSTERGLFFPLD